MQTVSWLLIGQNPEKSLKQQRRILIKSVSVVYLILGLLMKIKVYF